MSQDADEERWLQCDVCQKWRIVPPEIADLHCQENVGSDHWACGRCNEACDHCKRGAGQPSCDCKGKKSYGSDTEVLGGKTIPHFKRLIRWRTTAQGKRGRPWVKYEGTCPGCGKKLASIDRVDKVEKTLAAHRRCTQAWSSISATDFDFKVEEAVLTQWQTTRDDSSDNDSDDDRKRRSLRRSSGRRVSDPDYKRLRLADNVVPAEHARPAAPVQPSIKAPETTSALSAHAHGSNSSASAHAAGTEVRMPTLTGGLLPLPRRRSSTQQKTSPCNRSQHGTTQQPPPVAAPEAHDDDGVQMWSPPHALHRDAADFVPCAESLLHAGEEAQYMHANAAHAVDSEDEMFDMAAQALARSASFNAATACTSGCVAAHHGDDTHGSLALEPITANAACDADHTAHLLAESLHEQPMPSSPAAPCIASDAVAPAGIVEQSSLESAVCCRNEREALPQAVAKQAEGGAACEGNSMNTKQVENGSCGAADNEQHTASAAQHVNDQHGGVGGAALAARARCGAACVAELLELAEVQQRTMAAAAASKQHAARQAQTRVDQLLRDLQQLQQAIQSLQESMQDSVHANGECGCEGIMQQLRRMMCKHTLQQGLYCAAIGEQCALQADLQLLAANASQYQTTITKLRALACACGSDPTRVCNAAKALGDVPMSMANNVSKAS